MTRISDQLMKRLKKVAQNHTLDELSERTGLHKSTLSRLLNGRRLPTVDHLEILAEVFNLRVR